MRVFAYKITIVSICVGLFIFLSNYQVQGQPEKPLNLSDIKAKLTSAFRVSEPAAEINEQLVKEICNRRVNFTLISEDEKSLKKAGASDLLIKTIRENSTEETKEMTSLYEKYEVNYQAVNIEQKKIALDAAKEFVKKYENSECLKEQVNYFKEAIPALESVKPHPSHPSPDPKRENLKRLIKLDNAYKAKNYTEFFDIGAEILEVEPDFLDLIFVLAGIGFDQAKVQGNNGKFNDETIRYAELAVKLLESGKESEYKDYGEYEYKYKTNALNKMNEIIEYMKNQKLN